MLIWNIIRKTLLFMPLLSFSNPVFAEDQSGNFSIEQEKLRNTRISTQIGTLRKLEDWQESALKSVQAQKERGIKPSLPQLPAVLCQDNYFLPLCKISRISVKPVKETISD